MPVYSLYLNTANTNANYAYAYKFSQASIQWNINFDDLFQGDNKKFDKCRVRFHLLSTPWTASTTSDWDNYVGYLSVNLDSKYQQNRGVNGTVLGFINPSLPAVTTIQSGKIAYNNSTLNTCGVDINVPQGYGPLWVNMYTDSPGQALISWSTEPTYQLLLEFELY